MPDKCFRLHSMPELPSIKNDARVEATIQMGHSDLRCRATEQTAWMPGCSRQCASRAFCDSVAVLQQNNCPSTKMAARVVVLLARRGKMAGACRTVAVRLPGAVINYLARGNRKSARLCALLFGGCHGKKSFAPSAQKTLCR